ncbi:MAG TPA: ABC transporter substrate-binding protein [Ilumatobacter sp.]|nr:ABC transporter substrate-binding protein [Ilumatobacter sp.]
MRPTRTQRRAIALAAAVALTIAACGGDDDDPASTEPAPTAASPDTGTEADQPPATTGASSTPARDTSVPTATDGPDAAPPDVPEHDPNAVLRVIGYSPPAHLDPVRGVPACEFTHLRMVYDSLVRLGADGLPKPGLAESWEVVDDETFVLHIRPGVIFQDGTPFDAEAVREHLERGKNDPESTIVDNLRVIDEIVVVDDLTLELRLNEPRAGTMTTLFAERAGMVPSAVAVAASGADYGTTSAVGAGPYAMESLNPGQLLSVRAWGGDDYWANGGRLLAGLDFYPVDDTTGIQRVQSGEIDYMATKDDNIEIVRAADDLAYEVAPTNTFAQIFMNFGRPPFDDVRVRQALNHALDRELLTQVLSGAGDVAWGPLSPTSWAHNPAIDEMYPYDPDKARELLAEAGYPDGVSFTAAMIDHPYYTRMAQAVQDMLADSGIDVELATVTGAEINNALYVRQEYDAAITAYAGSSDPALTLERKYTSGGSANPSGQTIDGLEDLLAEGARLVDPDERAPIYQEAELLVMENALEVPIYFLGGLSVFDPSVHGIDKGYETCSIGNFIDPPAYIAVD